MKQNEEEPEGPCTLCGYMYADPKDPKIVEFWLQCKLCKIGTMNHVRRKLAFWMICTLHAKPAARF